MTRENGIQTRNTRSRDRTTSATKRYATNLFLLPSAWTDNPHPQEYLRADSIAFRQAMSVDAGDPDSGDTDSERGVERLLIRPATTDSSSVSVSPPSPHLSTPPHTFPSEKSPGHKWKQTVLIPVDATQRLTKPSTLVLAPIASSPRTLTQAGWDTASSDIES